MKAMKMKQQQLGLSNHRRAELLSPIRAKRLHHCRDTKLPSPLRARRLLLVLTLAAFCVRVFWKETHLLRRVLPFNHLVAPGDVGTAPPAAEKTTADGAAEYPAFTLSNTDDVIPLPSLTRSSEAAATACPRGLVPVLDAVLPLAVTHAPSRKIPKVVHITSQSRCVTPGVHSHVEQWRRTTNHSFFFHDDVAVRRLLSQGWVDQAFRTGRGANQGLTPGAKEIREGVCSLKPFYPPDRPASDVALKCATTGATLSDLWRYAVLYRYGGIYSDLDNSKGKKWRDDLVQDADDFVGTVERIGIIGQYWLAASPGHPYLRHTMDTALAHLRVMPNVMLNVPHKTTGPGAVKRGFCSFMAAVGKVSDGYVTAGNYVGDHNRSVNVIGRRGKPGGREYVNRAGLGHVKKEGFYKAANITHFWSVKSFGSPESWVSCEEHLNRSAGEPGKQANYVYDAAANKFVDAL